MVESDPVAPSMPDAITEAALTERLDADEALAMSEATSREIGQLRRDVAQLTETVALLLDMQQGTPRTAPAATPPQAAGLTGAVASGASAAVAQGQQALQRGQEVVGEAVGQFGGNLERQVASLSREVTDMAERNPLGTVLGALGVGFLVGVVLRRR